VRRLAGPVSRDRTQTLPGGGSLRASPLRRALAVAAGVAGARAVLRALGSHEALSRTNFRGRTVSLAGGPALAAGAAVSAAVAAPSPAAAAAAFTAGVGSGAVGLYDDVVGNRPEQKAAKGFAGHLAALREGRVTSGLVKIAGVGAAGLAASALLAADPARERRATRAGRAADLLLGAGVIAGTANLLNLFDLRPGRAIKAGGLIGVPLSTGRAGGLAAGPLSVAASVLPDDLDERVMLGDSGANALGALLGVALAARTGPAGRAAALAAIAALTAASEKVSFTKVIEANPVLRQMDALGRRTS
jgi:UDP-N-acetylmuramyl pentapeptide phosphotransferase/UDP-N-acetylglucosamine-1-phosphate transferase